MVLFMIAMYVEVNYVLLNFPLGRFVCIEIVGNLNCESAALDGINTCTSYKRDTFFKH